jgi:hypothetical protein
MKGGVWILVIIFSVFLVSATPTLLIDQAQPEQWPCDEFKVIQKTFFARSENINIGFVCPLSSKIELFDCSSGECLFAINGYKNNGALPTFNNFNVGKEYKYHCYSCENTCAISITEKEKVNLNNFFQGIKFKLGESKAGLNENGIWITKKGDAGDYNVEVQLYDGKEWENVQFCINVKKANDAPKLKVSKNINVKEGEVLMLNAECVDPEGEETSVSYSGFTDVARKRVSFDDYGNHKVIVSCSDGVNVVKKSVSIFVTDVNRAPVILDVFSS